MSQRRLAWLLSLMSILVVLRLAIPMSHAPELPVVPARVSISGAADAQAMPNLNPLGGSEPGEFAEGTREMDEGPVANAFQVRAPALMAASMQASQLAARPVPPLPKPAPPPVTAAARASDSVASVRVIGSWFDELGISVFVATPAGVLQRREGDLLPGGFVLTGISAQGLRLRKQPSGEETMIPVQPGVIALAPPSR